MKKFLLRIMVFMSFCTHDAFVPNNNHNYNAVQTLDKKWMQNIA